MAGRRRTAERAEARLRAALSWPGDPPAPLTAAEMAAMTDGPGRSGTPVRAWTYNLGRGHAMLGAFDRDAHNIDGPLTTHFNAKGQGGPWFATESDATAALRHAATVEVAHRLLALDDRLDAARRRDAGRAEAAGPAAPSPGPR